MKVRVILNGPGGQLDATEIDGTYYPSLRITRMQERIHAAIAAWTLSPGDTIVIEGDEEAFNAL